MAGNAQGKMSDLPSDILGAIYRRCTSPYDRACFAAVCVSWSTATLTWRARLPALPLLLPSTGNGRRDRATRAYSPEDGRVLRAPLPWFPWGRRIVGCHDGGWVAAATGSRVAVVNLFTRSHVMLPPRQRNFPNSWAGHKDSFEKIVFSETPSSKGCILAARTVNCKIAVCRPDLEYNSGWTMCWARECPSFLDITFCNGELYGLSRHQTWVGNAWLELHRLFIDRNVDDEPAVTTVELLTTEGRPIMSGNSNYVFELRGKPAIAVEITNYCKVHDFRVFELAADCGKTTVSYKYTWVELTSLGDYALFLGRGCCKAVQVSPAVGMQAGVEANRIYYSSSRGSTSGLDRLDLGSCAVYCCESDGIECKIKSRGYHYDTYDCEYIDIEKDGGNGHTSCTWVLPPRF